jgi:hypothetical protein
MCAFGAQVLAKAEELGKPGAITIRQKQDEFIFRVGGGQAVHLQYLYRALLAPAFHVPLAQRIIQTRLISSHSAHKMCQAQLICSSMTPFSDREGTAQSPAVRTL